ncbi:MAG: PTS sugar transporter subunit IIB [Candidatus Eisenbacteria bacterium]|uniref:PTS sugar transporter subunit IIB n=2 Tax=Eiseniibacteriota bacterium TaxID=2212470 RepID=A0A538SAP7_UNCEI|nr:MAG: PTS sugar transporter subunit IIB [Candidatus Eisenbacteria bacterium]
MPLLLARIDDRLIHGQVVHGWGGTLRPTWIGIVSDALTREPARAALYVFAAPEESRAEVISIPEALRESTLQTIRAERSFLLFPSVLEPLRLKEGGFPLEEVNVGGLHHAPGKSAVLPYVYLDQGDREKLLALSRLGVRLVAQDLPTNPAHPLEPFLQGTP